jgi:hypothetical protein
VIGRVCERSGGGMNSGLGGAWALFAKSNDLTDDQAGWLLVAVGLAFLLAAVLDIRAGRTYVAFRNRWWMLEYARVGTDNAPIQFLVRMVLQIVAGLAMLGYGARLLLG